MELILYNGNIVTHDTNLPRCEAVAVDGGIIIQTGSNEQILKLKTANTEVIDLNKSLVLPGFNDSHMHLLNYGISLELIDLENCKSIDQLVEKAKHFIHNNQIPNGKWVRGMRWNHHIFSEKRLPTRYDLDKISTEHPIILSRVCGHVIVANSKAMEEAGISRSTSQVKGGYFDIDESGEPLGIFRENAIELIYQQIPNPTTKELKRLIKLAADNLSKHGVTSVQSDDFIVFPKSYENILQAFFELNDKGELPLRVYEQCNFKDVKTLNDFLNKGFNTGYGDDYFKIGPLKLLADGSLGARTAYLNKPYSDDGSTNGIPVFTQEELDALVLTAHKRNMQIAIHAIGDKTMYMIFESYEKAQAQKLNENARHAIIHCQITDELLLEKFKEQDIIAHIQPLFVATDLHFVEERIGVERTKTSYSWKTMLNNDVHLAFGSDAPVESPNVLTGIYAAVNRTDLSGYPNGGWLPEQKLTVAEAVYGYTMGSAFASFEENIKGSITPGKFADMVVLSKNIFEINVEEIKETKVEMTFVGGKLVYTSVTN